MTVPPYSHNIKICISKTHKHHVAYTLIVTALADAVTRRPHCIRLAAWITTPTVFLSTAGHPREGLAIRA